MKAFIKTNWWKILVAVIVLYLSYTGASIIKDYFFRAAMAAAKGEYEDQIAKINVSLAAKDVLLKESEERSAKKISDIKAEHAEEIKAYKKDISYFKSETAEALKARKATEREWAAAKTQDEITITIKDEEIVRLDRRVYKTLAEWQASDEEKAVRHGAIVADWEAKFAKCQEWSGVLEKKIKKKPLLKVFAVAAVVAAYTLGRGIK
jgi:hypothetical protein